MSQNSKKRRDQKKRLKDQKNKRQSVAINPNKKSLDKTFHVMENPIGDISFEDKQRALKEMGEKAQVDYDDALKELEQIFENYSPLQLLAMLTFYDLVGGVSDSTGIDTKDKPFGVSQFHSEFAQAFILRDLKYAHAKIIPNHIYPEFRDTLSKLSKAVSFRDYKPEILDLNESELAIFRLRKTVRGHTQIVRNWGFIQEVKRISKELFSALDNDYKKANGFTASNAIDFFEHLLLTVESRMTDHMNTFKVIMLATGKKELTYSYYRDVLKQTTLEAEEFIQSEIYQNTPLRTLKGMFMAHRDLFIFDAFEFNIPDITKNLNFDTDTLKALINKFSHTFGDLKEIELNNIIFDNPVWHKPLIRISDDSFFCSTPQVFFSFILKSLTELAEDFSSKLEKRKANYLEDRIESIVRSKFPENMTFRGVKWKHEDKDYETDLITVIGSCLLIIEAKSGKITLPALRGAPDRLRRHLNDIIISPNQQSKRLKEKLIEIQAGRDSSPELLEQVKIDFSKITKIIRLSVSLEDFAMIQSNVKQHDKTGWFPKDFSPCPTLNLADFEILFDLLDHPLMILHYLERRESIERSFNYFGDELDLMGHYVDTLLGSSFFPKAENVVFHLDGHDKKVRHYYDSLSHGVKLTKPKPPLDEFWEKILKKIEERNFTYWTEVGMTLLQVSPIDQKEISKKIKLIKKNVKKEWRTTGHINTMVFNPAEGLDTAICFVFFCNQNKDLRDHFIDSAVDMGLKSAPHIKKSLVIAFNIDMPDTGYNFIGMFYPDVNESNDLEFKNFSIQKHQILNPLN